MPIPYLVRDTLRAAFDLVVAFVSPPKTKKSVAVKVTSEADLTRRAMLRASAAAGSGAEHPLGLCLWPSRLEAAKRVGSARTARVEHADRVFERAFEFNQHRAVPFGVSKMVDENQRRVENRSQITGASRCHRGEGSFGRGCRNNKSARAQ